MNFKLRILTLCCFLLAMNIQAQTTYVGNLTFTSQADLNAFSSTYTSVTGTVRVYISDVTDLSPLYNLQTIGGSLRIDNNQSLLTINGFNNLVSIGGSLIISRNYDLIDVNGFNNLTTLGGFNVEYCHDLVSFTGLNQLTAVGDDIRFYWNRKLAAVNAFNNLTSVGDDFQIAYCNLFPGFSMFSGVTSIPGFLQLEEVFGVTNLQGLDNITSVGSYLQIEGLTSLTNLDDLSGLTTIGTGLQLESNSALQDIIGLSNVTFTSSSPNLNIKRNTSLTTLAPLSFISGQVQNLVIQFNDNITDFTPLSGINHVRFRMYISEESITSLDGLENITHVGDDLEIYFCDDLLTTDALSNLTYIGGNIEVRFNRKLRDVDFMNNITVAQEGLEISFNDELDDFSGLSNLTTVNQTLYLRDNGNIDMSGFGSLTTVGRDFTSIVNRDQVYTTGIENLTTVGRNFTFSNFNVVNMNGFSGLTTVNGYVRVYNFGSADLVSIDGLSNLNSIGSYLSITGNNLLDDCCVLLPILDTPGAIGGSVTISNNSTNCNSLAAVDNWCRDLDNDGVTGKDGDCDNHNNQIYPGNVEICDGLDNDCNNLIDDDDPNIADQTTWYDDSDGDGYGDPDMSILSCNQPMGYVDNALDNCVNVATSDLADDDCDGVGNACDVCPGGDDSRDTDGDGTPDCMDWDGFSNLPSDFICGNNKVYICHIPPGNPANRKTKCVNKNSVSSHMAHGDYLGECDVVECSSGSNLVNQQSNELNSNSIVAKFQFENDLTVYPNPANNEVNIFVKNSMHSSIDKLSIISSTGQIIQEMQNLKTADLPIQINLNEFEIGVYFIQLQFENETPLTQRLVVMK